MGKIKIMCKMVGVWSINLQDMFIVYWKTNGKDKAWDKIISGNSEAVFGTSQVQKVQLDF